MIVETIFWIWFGFQGLLNILIILVAFGLLKEQEGFKQTIGSLMMGRVSAVPSNGPPPGVG